MPDQDPSYRLFIESRVSSVEKAGEAHHAAIMAAFAAQDVTLSDIKRNVEKTNGRVNRHDVAIAVLTLVYTAGAFMAGAWYAGWVRP